MKRNSSSRKDIKLGIIFSMAAVLVVGGYYVFRGTKEAPIPIVETPGGAKPNAAPAKNSPSPAAPNAANNRLANGARNGAMGSPSTSNSNRPAPASRPAVSPAPNSNSPNPSTATQPIPGQVASKSPVVAQPSSPNSNVPSPTPAKPEPASSMTGGPASPAPAGTDRMASGNSPVAPPLGQTNQPTALENRALTPTSPAVDGHTTPLGPVASNDAPKGFDLARKPDSQPAAPAMNNGAKSLTAMPPVPPPTVSNPPAKTPAATEAHTPAVDTHRVQQGDTFVSLAKSYYGSARYAKFLKDANPAISDGAQLTPGTAIKIPPLPNDLDKAAAKDATTNKTDATAAKNAVATKGGKRTYTAKSGDSLYKIAKDQLGSSQRWKDVFELNKAALHNDPTQLRVGQTLVLPET